MINLEKLPFNTESFQEFSKESFEIHYTKHHATYVKNLNSLLENCEIQFKTLEEIIIYSNDNKNSSNLFNKIFNNAAQHYNHAFFWNSISSLSAMNKTIEQLIEKSFENYEQFEKIFIEKGLSLFGSGWVWLCYNKTTGLLEIILTNNAETCITSKLFTPLLVCDVWEHAYYVDFLNNRSEFLKNIIKHFNWQFAIQNLEKYESFRNRIKL